MDAIFNRRSVRKYTTEPISEEHLTTLLKAAMRAPSAGNQQAWEFIVVRDAQTKAAMPALNQFAAMAPQADVVVAICANTRYSKYEEAYWVQDCSAATQNLLLEAHHLGIGAVWLGTYPNPARVEGFQKLLDLPEHVIPISVIALGHPAVQPEPMDTYRPERIHRERW